MTSTTLGPSFVEGLREGLTAGWRAARRHWLRIRRPNQIPPPYSTGWLVWLILAGRGWGKALALDTPLPTPDGWTTMGEVKVGDLLLDEQGQPCRVTFATPVQHGRTCYRVLFDDGSEIIADADHLWETWDKRARKAHGRATNPRSGPAVRTTAEIRETLTVSSGRERNHSIVTAQPLDLPEADLPVHPYVLGAWLGDGTSATAEITIGDSDAEEMLGHLAACGERVTGKVRRAVGAAAATYPIGGRTPRRWDTLCTRLRLLGVLGAKHIPPAYLRASAAQRLALLQGLMDTDGSVQVGGHVELITTSRPLAEGVHELAVSLGFKVTCAEERARLDGRDCGPRWRISWTTDSPVFRLARKAARLRTTTAQGNRTRHRYVVAVEPVESVPVRCIQVSSASHLFLAGRSMIPTHNSRVGAEATADFMREHPGCRVALVAATFADGRDTMVEGESGLLAVLDPTELRGGTIDKGWNRSIGELYLGNGSRARIYSSEKPGRLRGPQHHWAWCDELCQWLDAWKDAGEVQTTWSNLRLGLRLRAMKGWPDTYQPRIIVTTTPKPVKLLAAPQDLVDREPHRAGITQLPPDELVVTTGSTMENLDNLAEVYRKRIVEPMLGTRIGEQELEAKILGDTIGALLKLDLISQHRVLIGDVPRLQVAVTAVDPATTAKEGSSETGIVTSGLFGDDAYVLRDSSGRYSPDEWARTAWRDALALGSSAMVVEDNAGGDMVETTLLTAWAVLAREGAAKGRTMPARPPIVRVTPSGTKQGKWARAQPVALVYEQGRVHHVVDPEGMPGHLARLEDQATTWTGNPKEPSPDRVDALVHGLRWLLFPHDRAKSTQRGAPQRRRGSITR